LTSTNAKVRPSRADIDFPPGTRAAVEDTPAVQPQLQADEYFGAATALLRLLTIHFERSSARA